MQPWVWSVLLLALGTIFILLEVFVPSAGVLSVLAAIAILAAIIVAFTGGLPLGIAVLATTLVGVPLLIALAIRWWPHTPMGRRMLIQLPEPDEAAAERLAERRQLLGKVGRAKSTMLPSGAVVLEGRTYDAVSQGMPIEAGQTIEVVEVHGLQIVVRPSTRPLPTSDETGDELLSRPVESPFEDDPLA